MALAPSDAPTAFRGIRKTNRCPETPKRKRRPGRPSSYRPEYCDVIIEAGKEGWSLTATAAKIGVHRATLFDWGTAHPEFGDALKSHRAHRAHSWEERLRDIAKRGGADVLDEAWPHNKKKKKKKKKNYAQLKWDRRYVELQSVIDNCNRRIEEHGSIDHRTCGGAGYGLDNRICPEDDGVRQTGSDATIIVVAGV